MELEHADEEVLLEKQQFAGGARRDERKDHVFAVAFTANLAIVTFIAVSDRSHFLSVEAMV